MHLAVSAGSNGTYLLSTAGLNTMPSKSRRNPLVHSRALALLPVGVRRAMEEPAVQAPQVGCWSPRHRPSVRIARLQHPLRTLNGSRAPVRVARRWPPRDHLPLRQPLRNRPGNLSLSGPRSVPRLPAAGRRRGSTPRWPGRAAPPRRRAGRCAATPAARKRRPRLPYPPPPALLFDPPGPGRRPHGPPTTGLRPQEHVPAPPA